MTHFATADLPAEADGGFFREQYLRFRAAVDGLRGRFPGDRPANSVRYRWTS
jgi:hypothetical protein